MYSLCFLFRLDWPVSGNGMVRGLGGVGHGALWVRVFVCAPFSVFRDWRGVL